MNKEGWWHSLALNPGPPFQSWQILLFKIYPKGQLLINSLLSILLSAMNSPKKSFSILKFSSGTSLTSGSYNSIFTISNFCIHTPNCTWTGYQGGPGGVDKTPVKNQWNSACIKLSQNYSLKNKTYGGPLKVTDLTYHRIWKPVNWKDTIETSEQPLPFQAADHQNLFPSFLLQTPLQVKE